MVFVLNGKIITEEQAKYIDDEVVDVIRRELVGKQLLPVTGPLGLGVQVLGYDELKDMKDAVVDYIFREAGEDIISLARKDIAIPIINQQFKIHRRDLASSKRTGTPLDTSVSVTAAAKCAEALDQMILKEDPKAKIQGLFRKAGQTVSTAYDFATFGNAVKALRDGMKLLVKKNIGPPYNWVLNADSWAELMGSMSTNGTPELIQVEKMLGDGGKIYTSTVYASTEAILLPIANKKYFDLVVAQDFVTEFSDLKTGDVWGQVFGCFVPRIKHTDAVVKYTNL